MAKKVLLLFPKRYSMTATLCQAFTELGWDAEIVDYLAMAPAKIHSWDSAAKKLPGVARKWWQQKYHGYINKNYLSLIKLYQPDLLIIYNHQFIDPDLLRLLHPQLKIVFLLGDHPLYSLTYKYNLRILEQSDCTICPDTHFLKDLKMMGIPNLVHDLFGASEAVFHPVDDIPDWVEQKYRADLLYVGTSYGMASGYKRALFLNSFAGEDLKIFGPANWDYWLPMFPNLRKHYHLTRSRISDEELNLAMNCAKIYPIDQNQGIINGIHVRVFEAIAAGILPLVEYRSDIDIVFGDLLPVIKSYTDAKELARHYLDNEVLRVSTIQKLRSIVKQRYSTVEFAYRLLHKVGI